MKHDSLGAPGQAAKNYTQMLYLAGVILAILCLIVGSVFYYYKFSADGLVAGSEYFDELKAEKCFED